MSCADAPGFSGVAVLVVEDNEVNRKVTSAMLQHFGIKPDIAENGQKAIKYAEKRKYDLILMDCQMPVMDGFETTDYLRGGKRKNRVELKTPADVVIIAMTANVSPDDVAACMSCGMDDFIAKPVELEIIRKMLQKWVL